MRDPERTMVCDILANGSLLMDGSGKLAAERYAAGAQPVQQEPVAWDVEESVLAIHRILKSAASFSTREDALRSELKSVFQAGRAKPLPIAQPVQQEALLGTKTWFDGEKVITQNLTASDVYAAPVQAQEHPISSGHPDDAGFELWWSEHMPEAVQSVAISAWNAAQPVGHRRALLEINKLAWGAGVDEGYIVLQKVAAIAKGALSATTVQAQEQRKPLSSEQIDMLNFLYGAGELDGVWFGARHPTERGEFWWRKHLRRVFPDGSKEQPSP